MTNISTYRMAMEQGSETKLMLALGEQNAWLLRKILRHKPHIAYFMFADLFENPSESGIHKHIVELEFGHDFFDSTMQAFVTPVAARIEISLEDYDRIRRQAGSRGATPSEYTVLEV